MSNRSLTPLDKYQKYVFRKRLVLAAAAAATLLAALYAAGVGSIHIPIDEIIRTIFGGGDAQSRTVIMGIRLPRVASGLLVGAILASSGAVMQCVLQNPLASSSTLGVSQGAAFGAAAGIVLFSGGTIGSSSASAAVTITSPFTVTLCAFICGSLSTLVVVAISQFKKDIGPSGLVLAGVALSSLFSGGSTLLQYFADETKIGAIVFWTFGSLSGTTWREIAILLAVFALSMLFFLFNRWNYNAMGSGADTARSLGVNARAVMLSSMLMCSLATAVAVSFVGIISFVGLIAPHIMRRFVGSDYRFLIPCSAVTGALLLILADLFARTVAAPVVLPIGAITSFLGAPIFLFLLFKGGRPMVSVSNITYAYARGSRNVLEQVGFDVAAGQCLAVLGNNGAGKSTLLKCIGRILCPAGGGAVMVDGKNIFEMSGREKARLIAYVPQNARAAHMTVFDAVLLGRRPYIRWDAGKEDRQIAWEIIRQMGLEDYALRLVHELSGGEAQKVMLARALAQQPRLLLLDEPTSSLDPRNQHEVLVAVRQIARSRQICVVLVIHDLNLAVRYCDRFLFLKDSRVYACGGPESVTPQALQDVYGMQAHVISYGGVPVIVPFPEGNQEESI